METKNDKNHRVSFLVGQKETFLSRLRELVAGRALQQAADDWDIHQNQRSVTIFTEALIRGLLALKK